MAKLLSESSYPFKGHVNKFYHAKNEKKNNTSSSGAEPVCCCAAEWEKEKKARGSAKNPIPVPEKWPTFYGRHQYAFNKKYTILEQYWLLNKFCAISVWIIYYPRERFVYLRAQKVHRAVSAESHAWTASLLPSAPPLFALETWAYILYTYTHTSPNGRAHFLPGPNLIKSRTDLIRFDSSCLMKWRNLFYFTNAGRW